MRLQSAYRTGLLRNHTPFGRRLRIVARRLLADHLRTYDFGFQDGGCAMFAQGLVEWSDGRLTLGSYVLPGRGVQHVVAHDDGIVLDSDGVSTVDEGTTKLALLEDCPGCRFVHGFDPRASMSIPWSRASSSEIAGRLQRMIGIPKEGWTS